MTGRLKIERGFLEILCISCKGGELQWENEKMLYMSHASSVETT